MKSQDNYLENDIESLEKRLDEDNLSETEKSQVLDELAARKLLKRRNLQTQNKRRDLRIRSKSRWYNDGENTKYFLKLEKRHFKKKKILKVSNCHKSVVEKDDEIIRVAKTLYFNCRTNE